MRFLCLLFLLFYLTGCGNSSKTLKVGATSVPHAEILEMIKPDMKEKGIQLDIIQIDDYQLPNRFLAEKHLDANFFQHMPFLEDQIKEFNYDLIALAKVHVEPLGIYSEAKKSLDEVEEEDTVLIPNDPTNEARALFLLQNVGLIKLEKWDCGATILNISENPKRLNIKEVDAPLLPRLLPDGDLLVIPANFILSSKISLKPLATDTCNTDYVNVLVIRREDKEREDLKLLSELLTSKKMSDLILEKYHGAIQPPCK